MQMRRPRRWPTLGSWPLILGCTLAVACSGPAKRAGVAGLGAPPTTNWSFDSSGLAAGVKYSASYIADHDEVFDEDLIAEARVLPIAIRVGMDQRASAPARWPENANLRLYLPDGTVCVALDPNQVRPKDRDVHERVTRHALRRGWLENYEDAAMGFAYFRLPEFSEYSSSAGTITLGKEGDQRTFALSKSLLGFRLSLEDEDRTLYVGLSSDRWVAAR